VDWRESQLKSNHRIYGIGFGIVLCFIIISFTLQAASDRDFKKVTLKNGVTVIYKIMKDQPRVSLNVVFPIGMSGEKEKGITHLAEHMVFRGGSGYNFDDIAGATIRNGGQFTGFTYLSATTFSYIVPKKNLMNALQIFNGSIWKTDTAETSLALERKIVLHELDMDYSERYQYYPVFRYLLPEFSYNADTIAVITPADLQEFYRTYYQPENATYILVGDFELKPVLDELEKVNNGYGKKGENVKITPQDFDLPAQDVEENRNLYPYQYQIMLAYQFNQMPEKDRLVLELLGFIYGYDSKINYEQNEFDFFNVIYRHLGEKVYFGIYYLERNHPLDTARLSQYKATMLKYFREFKKIDLKQQIENLAQLVELEEIESQETAESAAQYEVNCLIDPDFITADTLTQIKNISEKDLERVIDQYFSQPPRTWILVKTTKTGGK
jgi:predicted Zn-dependent peptidase